MRASLREMAQELLRLYAERQVVEGLAIGPDTPWQHEFEAAFAFEETPDQLEAIRQVKADLERRQPMDRLVCGDVGYGKTEVAMRAALKVALDGHQVAVLVPTTILAEQHWNTFRERFAPYPVRVEMLSRFRSPVQQKAVLAGLAAGTVDVVIGTHRLLSKDVAFKDLGLLVVDEEHRFGVGAQGAAEAAPEVRPRADADGDPHSPHPVHGDGRDPRPVGDRVAARRPPGGRDGRLPVRRPRDQGGDRARAGPRRPGLRGPQPDPVLAGARPLHQRGSCPARGSRMAHGQLRETILERTMLDYVSGAYDVLVATAIIESGLDIPASNTIIINRADRLGLAQLYQLRGRVGRDRLQAYAYLLIPADGRVDETAAKRLRVIQELTALGSGLKIALRDMEIRGAGNLLGAQQHGQIEMVGFDLYLKLLEEAVRELRGEPGRGRGRSRRDRGCRRLPARATTSPSPPSGSRSTSGWRGSGRAAEIEDVRRELRDRFGPLPEAAARLLDVVALRLDAKALRLERLEVRAGHALLTFAPSTPVPPQRIIDLLRLHGRRLRTVREFVLEATVARGPWPETFQTLTRLLGEFRGPMEARR